MKTITDMTPTPENQEIIYNSLDTMQTMKLKELFDAGLLPAWAAISYGFSEKMLGPVMTMMRRGVRIDLKKRDEIVAILQNRAAKVRTTFDTICVALFGTTININSRPQLDALFHTFLGIPQQIRSKKGETKASLDKDALEKIAKDYPRGAIFCNLILKVRDLEKQVEFLQKALSPAGRFHTSYNISGTETFRVSSSQHPLRIGCVPDTAEAYTPDGWVPIKEQPISIAQWSSDGCLTFVQPVWNFQSYTGTLHKYNGRCVVGLFTDNHKIPYYSSKGNFLNNTANVVAHKTCVSTPVSGVLYAGETKDANWIRKLVMLSADGNEYAPNKWRIKFKKERKNLRCAFVLGVAPKQLTSYGYFDYSTTVENVTKKFPNVLEWDATSRQIFMEELQYWDAHRRGKSFVYYTTIKENADLVISVAHITGYSASVFVNSTNSNQYGNTSTKPLYSVNVSPKTINKLESKRWTTEQYAGVVGCPTVPSGYWLIRYNGHIYVTGNSNQQNIPRDDDIRSTFASDPGYVFFQADQQGAEARLVAYRSGDEAYIEACESGDAHTMVASLVFGFEPIRELAERDFKHGKSYRQASKSGSHGSNYMGKPYTLAQQMGVPQEAAEEFQIKYFKRFPGIQKWHVETAKQLQKHGWLENPFGMRRTFWQRRWDDATLREAIAFYPQSAVGVLTNIILYKLWLQYEGQPGAPVQILMNGHDAVIGQIREDLAPTLIPQLLKDMEFPFPITDIHGKVRTVTIPFDMEVGYNWGKFNEKTNPRGLKKWKPTISS